MTRKASSYRQSLMGALIDQTEAQAYLNAALEDSQPAFLKAIKNIAQAQKMTKVAKEAGVQRETLYRSLSEDGNPTLETLTSILSAVGMDLFVVPKQGLPALTRKTTKAARKQTLAPSVSKVRAVRKAKSN